MRIIFNIFAAFMNIIFGICERSVHGDGNRIANHAAGKLVFFGQMGEIDVGRDFDLFGDMADPEGFAEFCGQNIEIDLHGDAPVEGGVEFGGQICRHDDDAFASVERGEQKREIAVALGSGGKNELAVVEEQHGALQAGFAHNFIEIVFEPPAGLEFMGIDQEQRAFEFAGDGLRHERFSGARRSAEKQDDIAPAAAEFFESPRFFERHALLAVSDER